jgi:hypothetical protein
MKVTTNMLISRQVGIVVRAVDVENRTAEFIISTESPDTYGTVFKAAGAKMERYTKNPIVTYQHEDFSTDPDDVIGTSELRLEDNQWIARVTFEDKENDYNDKAEKIFRKVKKGTLRMASIMAEPIDGSMGDAAAGEDPSIMYFRNWELYSWSIVTHGSNPDALLRNVEAINSFKEANKLKPTDLNSIPRAQLRDSFKARILKLNQFSNK